MTASPSAAGQTCEPVRRHEQSLRKDEFGSEEALKKMNKYQKELRIK